MPFPLIKLAILAFKQVSKPIANSIKRKAKTSPTFRKICIWPAEVYNGGMLNLRLKMLGLGTTTKKQTPMNPEAAVELGAELIGEASLYILLMGLVFAEYQYSSISSEAKEMEKKRYLQSLENQIDELSLSVASLEAEIRELRRDVGDLDSKNYTLMQKVFGKKKT